MLIPFIVIVTILGVQFNELNAADLETKFNECLHKVTSNDCPTFDEVRQDKLNQLAKAEENAASDNVELTVANDCVVRPWIDRDWHWECLVPVMPWNFGVMHGPGHEDDDGFSTPQGNLDKPDRGRKDKGKNRKDRNRNRNNQGVVNNNNNMHVGD